jgi:hypothetical protein
MSSLIRYTFTFLGGAIFPYLFGKSLAEKKYFSAGFSILGGLTMFFVNGMKTWLYLYVFALSIISISYFAKENIKRITIFVEIMLIILILFSIAIYRLYDLVDIVGQVGRVIIIPNNIGFNSIKFFQDKELLFLRESIFRFISDSPYPGGSDFYINYGRYSTIDSSRANNGLWGDAYKNFGIFGIIFYPFLIGGALHLVEKNFRLQPIGLVVFIFFMFIWTSVNTSYFTWLVTGGVFIIIILAKFYGKKPRLRKKSS